MKRIIPVCLLILLSLPAWSGASVIGPARIRFVDGDIMFRTPDFGEWLPATINTPLDEGDTIWCPGGAKAEIQLSDGTMVRLDGGSQLDLLANEDSFIHLHLSSGRLYVRTVQTRAQNSLQIDADDTTVLPDARTQLRIDMLPDRQEDVSVFNGTAYVEGNSSRTKVRAGEHIALEHGHSELLPLNPPDAWENWNTGRDRIQLRAAVTDSNLPDELRSSSAELYSNGTWVSVPEYGMVWRPTLILTGDWAPYRNGQWIWRGSDYVWISSESWGWVPYHYGRWAVVSGFGWCWVPPSQGDVYWGPGYVGWYQTDSHIGWTPLAPGEIFYGYGRYGRHSVNIAASPVNAVTINYRNQHIQGGRTVLPKNDFLKGISAQQQRTASTPAALTASIGSPRIRPLRETRLPAVRQTPPQNTLPRIDHQDSRELRRQFQRLTPHGGQQSRPEPVTREQKQKKVWKVTSPEESKGKESREKEHGGR
ncbi:MAG: FecR family protein [Desulfuromonadales bacterium]